MSDALRTLFDDPETLGVFTDFDGTLSEIVSPPSAAEAVSGAQDVLEALAVRVGLVAIVSGRGLEDLRERIAPRGVLLAGAYGRERSDRTGRRSTEGWESVAIAASAGVRDLAGVLIERKGAGIAIHFRQAPEHEAAVIALATSLAAEFSLELRPGRQVVELVAPGPGKGEAIVSLIEEHGLRSAVVAGDDLADLEAFGAARDTVERCVIIAVASPESPPGLTDAADIVVNGPRQLVALFGAAMPQG